MLRTSNNIRSLPTLEKLRFLFEYDSDTGEIRWKNVLSNRTVKGSAAGSLNKKGYLMVGVDCERLYAHRIAYFMAFGRDPGENLVDHRNNIKSDNRACNLRLASNSQNHFNVPRTKANKSGVKGVCRCGTTGLWRAYIVVNYKQHRLGLFSTIEFAAEAVAKAREKLHTDFAHT